MQTQGSCHTGCEAFSSPASLAEKFNSGRSTRSKAKLQHPADSKPKFHSVPTKAQSTHKHSRLTKRQPKAPARHRVHLCHVVKERSPGLPWRTGYVIGTAWPVNPLRLDSAMLDLPLIASGKWRCGWTRSAAGASPPIAARATVEAPVASAERGCSSPLSGGVAPVSPATCPRSCLPQAPSLVCKADQRTPTSMEDAGPGPSGGMMSS